MNQKNVIILILLLGNFFLPYSAYSVEGSYWGSFKENPEKRWAGPESDLGVQFHVKFQNGVYKVHGGTYHWPGKAVDFHGSGKFCKGRFYFNSYYAEDFQKLGKGSLIPLKDGRYRLSFQSKRGEKLPWDFSYVVVKTSSLRIKKKAALYKKRKPALYSKYPFRALRNLR